MRLFRFFVLLLGLTMFALPTWAEGSGSGKATLHAMAYKPMPETGKTVTVRSLDNSDKNLALLQSLETVLRDKGYTIAKESNLVLTFETRDEVGAWSDRGQRTLIELESRGGGVGGDRQRARLNLFDSTSGGLLNKGEGGTAIVTPDRYRLDMTLDDRAARQILWQGWAMAETHSGNPEGTIKAMLSPMVNSIGQTVRRQTFNLP